MQAKSNIEKVSESVAKAETKIRLALKRKIKDPETAAMLKKN